MAKEQTLYDPEGRKYVTADPTEATRLVRGYGYTDKAPTKAKSTEDKK